MGFRFQRKTFLPMNLQDTDGLKHRLEQLGILTPTTIFGYCIAFSIAYIVDVVCTGKHDDAHFARVLADVCPAGASDEDKTACAAVYARAIATDVVRMCLERIEGLPQQGLHDKWPENVVTNKGFEVVRVKWHRGDLRRVSA
jgi:hypothetical protein